MDYVFLIPPPPFFEGTRAEFDSARVRHPGRLLVRALLFCMVLLFCIRVKLDKKDCDGRQLRMDCECAMIECLYDFAQGRCACARFAVGCIKSALCLH